MAQTIHRGIKSLIDEANAEIETLSAADSIKAAAGHDVVIVDIRDPREIERDGRIPLHSPSTYLSLSLYVRQHKIISYY